MKHQALFSSKDKSKNIKMLSASILLGVLRVKLSFAATGLNMVDCITDQSEDRISRSHETVMLMPEYLVVCCWRSVKEISLILGQLTKDVPVCDEAEISDGLLTHQQVRIDF